MPSVVAIPKVRAAPGVGKHRAPCTFVLVQSTPDWRRGKPCGRPSYYLFDGKPYCKSHAGHLALCAAVAHSLIVHGVRP